MAEAVAAAQAERSKRVEIRADQVLREYGRLAFANLADFVRPDGSTDLSEVSRDQMAAVPEVTVDELVQGRGEEARQILRVKVKLHDKKGALDSVARHLGMFASDALKVDLNVRSTDYSNYTDEELKALHMLLKKGVAPTPASP